MPLESQILELRERANQLEQGDSRRIRTREKLLKAERLLKEADRAVAEAHRELTSHRERW
jgi:hypothetical protein